MNSIVKWGYPDNFKPAYFFFFDEKILQAQKHVTPRSLCVREKLLSLLFSVSLFLLADFCLWRVCVRAKSFRPKKINRLKIVRIAPFYDTTFGEMLSMQFSWNIQRMANYPWAIKEFEIFHQKFFVMTQNIVRWNLSAGIFRTSSRI